MLGSLQRNALWLQDTIIIYLSWTSSESILLNKEKLGKVSQTWRWNITKIVTTLILTSLIALIPVYHISESWAKWKDIKIFICVFSLKMIESFWIRSPIMNTLVLTGKFLKVSSRTTKIWCQILWKESWKMLRWNKGLWDCNGLTDSTFRNLREIEMSLLMATLITHIRLWDRSEEERLMKTTKLNEVYNEVYMS